MAIYFAWTNRQTCKQTNLCSIVVVIFMHLCCEPRHMVVYFEWMDRRTRGWINFIVYPIVVWIAFLL